MIFLLEYDRRRGRLVTFKRFRDTNRLAAEKERLDLELWNNQRGRSTEIVLLEAATERALRVTHRRYFQNLRQIIEATT